MSELWRAQQERASDQGKDRNEKLDGTNCFPTLQELVLLVLVVRRLHQHHTPHTTHHTPHTTHHTPQQPVLEHAMVMLGGWYDEEGDPLIMMLNSGKSMPLVLVSPSYLAACGAEISFLNAILTEDTKVARQEGLSGMCFP
ncbi:hypothetical protein [uncultured Marinobacter sp.]|uniref:hypothetical protein n=1 Tax=uncultured Marinobacter sp. TaxID=187379 RepID=UPI002592A522|nr:hypothetical protein [uncultured Marinobacter sp.]